MAASLEGLLQVIGAAVGQVTLPVGRQAVTVKTGAATASSNVILTPLANPGGVLWVTRGAGSFTIHRGGGPSVGGSSAIPIAYLLIN